MSTKAKDHTAVDEERLAGGTEVSADHESDQFSEQPSDLEALRHEYAALEDRFLRQAADFQNFRRRAFEDRALALDAGRNQIALPMLDVLDDLRRSFEAAGSASNYDDSRAFSALHNGLKLVYEKFVSELDRLGIREMSVVGALFDEALHEAILQQPAPEGVAPGTVLGEVQRGYTMGDRVLRHARVVVAS
jgi:molecular chaperone GrpE